MWLFSGRKKEFLEKYLDELESDTKNILGVGSKFKEGNEDTFQKLGFMMPFQLRKYPCMTLTTPAKDINLDLLPREIEAYIIISFAFQHKKEKIISVIQKSIDFLGFEDSNQETKQKWAKCLEQYTKNPSIDSSNQKQMKEIILPILFFIRFQESQIISLENIQMVQANDTVSAFKGKLERFERYLEMKISVKILKEGKIFVQYPESESLERKDIWILINSNELPNTLGALFFDYSKTTEKKYLDSKLIRFENSEHESFKAYDIELIVSLLFLMNIKYRILKWQPSHAQKNFSARELIDSFIFDALFESLRYVKKEDSFLQNYQDQLKNGQSKVLLKWQDLQEKYENTVLIQIRVSKYFQNRCDVTLDSTSNPQNFDGFITKESDNSFTVIFEEVYQEIKSERYSSFPELLKLKSSFNISKSKIMEKSGENHLNKSRIQYLKYQFFPWSKRTELELIIEASFFCFFHFSCEEKNFLNFDKVLNNIQIIVQVQDVLKIQEAIDGVKSLEGISGLTQQQCFQIQRVSYILLEHMFSYQSRLFEKVDTKDEQPIVINFLIKFEEIFDLKIIVPHTSEETTDKTIDRYLSFNPDILLIFLDETYFIYKKAKIFTGNTKITNMSMNCLPTETFGDKKNMLHQPLVTKRKQQQQLQQQKQENCSGNLENNYFQPQMSYNLPNISEGDLPEQLLFHSDLVYLVKNWNQVLSLFYLMNIKSVISYRNNTEEEYFQISTARLIRSPIFACIFEKCHCQGPKDQHYYLEWNEYHYQQVNSIMNEIWPRIIAGQNYNLTNNLASQQNCYKAKITNPNSKNLRYLVKFLPQ